MQQQPTRRPGTDSALFLRPYSTKELVAMYNVAPKTFAKWLSPFKGEIGKKMGYYYTVLQVRVIIEKIGVPHFYEP